MKTYLDTLQHILDHSKPKESRTVVNTTSTFGFQNKFDLSEGFPLLTSKKIHWKSLVGELLWFIRGDTNIRWLQERGIRIWNEWADENGDLDGVYAQQWRRWEVADRSQVIEVDIRSKVDRPSDEAVEKAIRLTRAAGDDVPEEYQSEWPHLRAAYALWKSIIAVCYDLPGHTFLLLKGMERPTISAEWIDFKGFLASLNRVPFYRSWKRNIFAYTLCPHYYGANEFGPSTCVFLENAGAGSMYPSEMFQVTDHNKNTKFLVRSAQELLSQTGAYGEGGDSSLSLGNEIMISNRFSVTIVKPAPGKLFRPYLSFDQVAEAIRLIKEKPYDRGIIVQGWNASEINSMALRPCHTMYQWEVSDGKLNCMLTQRSADSFLGLPFNIASASLWTCMIAQVTGLKPGVLTHNMGDLHIYDNHLDQVKVQLERSPGPLPKLVLNPEITRLEDFSMEDIRLEGYFPAPKLSGKVAV